MDVEEVVEVEEGVVEESEDLMKHQSLCNAILLSVNTQIHLTRLIN